MHKNIMIEALTHDMKREGSKTSWVVSALSRAAAIRCAVLLVILACFTQSASEARQLSSAQMQCLSREGKPDFFYVEFRDSMLDQKARRVIQIKAPASAEVWYYAAKGMRYLFVNGKMDSTRAIDVLTLKKLLPASLVKPSDISYGMHRQQIEQLYGKPDTVENARIGLHKIEVLRYLTPAQGIKSFTLADDKLQAALIGFAFNQKKPA